MEALKLYSYARSSAAYRVRIALNLKQLDYHTVAVHLVKNGGENWKPDYLDINPQGLVPALDSGADKILFQSIAIVEYLDEKYPHPPLFPESLQQRAFCRGLAQIVSCDIHPLNNLRVLKYLKEELNITQHQIDVWYRHWIVEGFHAFEQLLQKRREQTTFCCGEQPGMADLCLIPQVYNAHRFNCELTEFPIIRKIEKSCMSIQAFQDAAPEAQPDAE